MSTQFYLIEVEHHPSQFVAGKVAIFYQHLTGRSVIAFYIGGGDKKPCALSSVVSFVRLRFLHYSSVYSFLEMSSDSSDDDDIPGLQSVSGSEVKPG